MQMQYFKVIKQGFSVRPPPRAKIVGAVRFFLFFFSLVWQQLLDSVSQHATIKCRCTQQELSENDALSVLSTPEIIRVGTERALCISQPK